MLQFAGSLEAFALVHERNHCYSREETVLGGLDGVVQFCNDRNASIVVPLLLQSLLQE